MSKFKVGDEVAVAAIMKIAAIQPQSNGTVSYSTDRGITIPEHLMEQIALSPKEQKAEEPKPAPQPAHRFKVGDRVVTPVGTGIVIRDDKSDVPYCIAYKDHPRFGNFNAWSRECDTSPAPEPPKFYTGKVFAVKTLKHENDHQIAGRVGRVFEFKNGVAQFDLEKYGMGINVYRYASFADICASAFATEWAEVKEPSDV